MSDLADLLKELEQVAKDTNLKEVKKKEEEISTATQDFSRCYFCSHPTQRHC